MSNRNHLRPVPPVADQPVCPPWCELTPGHPFDDSLGCRMHIAHVGSCVVLSSVELFDGATLPASIALADEVDLNADSARRLAADLSAAAALLGRAA